MARASRSRSALRLSVTAVFTALSALSAVSLGLAATAQATGPKVLGWGFSSPTALAAAGPDLFVAEPAAGTVLELGAPGGGLVRVLGGHFDGPVALAVVGPDLFVANEGSPSGFSLGGAGQGPSGRWTSSMPRPGRS